MLRVIAFTLILLFGLSSNCLALKDPAVQLQPAGIFTQLGTQLDPQIELKDTNGNIIKLKSILDDARPTIIIPTYYRCPRLCGLVLGGVSQLIRDLELGLGKDYKIVTYSFNPVEVAEEAISKREHYSKVLKESNKSIEGWGFYLADQQNSTKLNQQLGFGVVPDEQDFAHSAAIFIISPAGQISQYFSNIDFAAKDVRLALVEAAQGKIGTFVDQVMLFCFQFNATQGQYNWAVFRLLKVIGAFSILIVGGIIIYYMYREKFLRQK